MNLTKHEYVALELMKARDIGVKEAHDLASEFLQQKPLEVNGAEPFNNSIEQPPSQPFNIFQPQEGQRWVNLLSSNVLTIDTTNTICWGDSSSGHRQSISFPSDLSEWQLLHDNESPELAIKRAVRERSELACSDEMNKPLDSIFSNYTASVLRSNKIETLADLLKINAKEIECMYGIGVKSLREVRGYIKNNNLALGMLATH